MLRFNTLVNRVQNLWGSGRTSLLKLDESITNWKEVIKAGPRKHWDTGLHTLKFCLLDHLVRDLERFGNLKLLHESSFELWGIQCPPQTSMYKHFSAPGVGMLENIEVNDAGRESPRDCNKWWSKWSPWTFEKRIWIGRCGPYMIREGEKTKVFMIGNPINVVVITGTEGERASRLLGIS